MKIARNDYCPCGSGKKYKNCHWGKEDPVSAEPPRFSAPVSDLDDLDDLDPAKSDVMSPDHWEKLSKRIPRGMRKGFGPIIAQAKQYAETMSRQQRIDAALDVLEAHRAEYEKLIENTSEWFRRAGKLFDEEPFVDMRFHAGDVHRALEVVGYPPPGYMSKQFIEITNKAIRFLLDDAQRQALAQRLLLTLPDYVAAGRYLDGCIIQHSVDLTAELPEEGAMGPFLLAMFLHGWREWEEQREQEQRAMFKEVGISPEEIREMGYDGLEAWLRDMRNNPEKTAAMEEFLTKHPELGAMTQGQGRAAAQAAEALLQRKDARVLCLTPEEVSPWLEVLEQRLLEAPEGFASLPQAQPPDEAISESFANHIFDVASEMARAVFTPARLDRLKSQLHELQQGFSAANDEDALAGIHGALISVETTTAPEDSRFLIAVCWMSLRAGMEASDPSSMDDTP